MWMETVITVGLAAAFGLAGIVKLFQTKRFESTLREVGLGTKSASVLAVLIPTIEMASAIAILSKNERAQTAGSLAILLLSVAFVLVVAKVIRDGKTIACNCFGSISESAITPAALIRNLCILALSLILAHFHLRSSEPVDVVGLVKLEMAESDLLLTWLIIALVLSSAAMWFLMIRLLGLYGSLVANDSATPLLKGRQLGAESMPHHAPKVPVGTSLPADMRVHTNENGVTEPKLGDFLESGYTSTTLLFVSSSCPACESVKSAFQNVRWRWLKQMSEQPKVRNA